MLRRAIYESLITVTVITERQERSVAGTVYHDGKPRLVDIKGIRIDAEFGKSMIYVTNEDKPGFIGAFAGLLGEAKLNIATFHLGRVKQGGDAIALVEIDGPVPPARARQGAEAAPCQAGQGAGVLILQASPRVFPAAAPAAVFAANPDRTRFSLAASQDGGAISAPALARALGRLFMRTIATHLSTTALVLLAALAVTPAARADLDVSSAWMPSPSIPTAPASPASSRSICPPATIRWLQKTFR